MFLLVSSLFLSFHRIISGKAHTLLLGGPLLSLYVIAKGQIPLRRLPRNFPAEMSRGSFGDPNHLDMSRWFEKARDQSATNPLCRSNGMWERVRRDTTNRLWHIDQSRVS